MALLVLFPLLDYIRGKNRAFELTVVPEEARRAVAWIGAAVCTIVEFGAVVLVRKYSVRGTSEGVLSTGAQKTEQKQQSRASFHLVTLR